MVQEALGTLTVNAHVARQLISVTAEVARLSGVDDEVRLLHN
jgi:hypothetical protein